jgi:hypothetical protein
MLLIAVTGLLLFSVGTLGKATSKQFDGRVGSNRRVTPEAESGVMDGSLNRRSVELISIGRAPQECIYGLCRVPVPLVKNGEVTSRNQIVTKVPFLRFVGSGGVHFSEFAIKVEFALNFIQVVRQFDWFNVIAKVESRGLAIILDGERKEILRLAFYSPNCEIWLPRWSHPRPLPDDQRRFSKVVGAYGGFCRTLISTINEQSRSQIEGRNNQGHSGNEKISSFKAVGFCFVALIFFSFGIVLLNRTLSLEYLHGTMNLNIATYRALFAWFMMLIGWMLFIFHLSEIL